MSRQHLCSQGYEPLHLKDTTLKVDEPPWVVLVWGSWSVVRFRAWMRMARRPFSRMMAPTVGAETLVPVALSKRVS